MICAPLCLPIVENPKIINTIARAKVKIVFIKYKADDVYKQVKVLSGGEKVRCMISKMMLSGANFLVFDQPTNHLDLESIAALNNGMAAFPYNIIFTSHDHQLTQTVANRIIEITPDGIIDRRCTYDEYMHIAGQETE